jgi:hypothetical protein
MKHLRSVAGLTLGLCLAACGPGGEAGNAQNAANEAAAEPAAGNDTAAAAGNATAAAGPAFPGCPFRETTNWVGSIEGGKLLVNGNVDLLMGGFKPQLTERAGSAPPVLRLDLALAPGGTTELSNKVRYEKSGSPTYRRGEIYCGGEQVAAFDMILVG